MLKNPLNIYLSFAYFLQQQKSNHGHFIDILSSIYAFNAF